jgi:hypothetical protein
MTETKIHKNSNKNSYPTLGRLITIANSYSNRSNNSNSSNTSHNINSNSSNTSNKSNSSNTSHSHNNLKVHMLNS